jgi:hypothetical protein
MLTCFAARTEPLVLAARPAADLAFLLPFKLLFKLFFWIAMTISLPISSILYASYAEQGSMPLAKLLYSPYFRLGLQNSVLSWTKL